MTVNNVSTFGSLQSVLQNMSGVQNDLNTAQQQISSGEVSQNFQGLGGNVEQYTAFNAELTRIGNYLQGNSVVISQMQTTNTALTQIESIANNVKSLIASQSSGSNSTASFTQQINNEMTALQSALNTQYGSSYIFGGSNTDTPPVVANIPASDTVGVPDSNYYQGSDQEVTARIADGQTITPNVSANNLAFQQLFAGIRQALASVSGTGTSQTDLTGAENLISEGLQGVIGLQATVNANIVNVQQVDTQLTSTQTYLKSLVSQISSADVVSLSAQVAQDQSVLEATFSAFSRISSLSIVSYLPQA